MMKRKLDPMQAGSVRSHIFIGAQILIISFLIVSSFEIKKNTHSFHLLCSTILYRNIVGKDIR